MIRSIPQHRSFNLVYNSYVFLFFTYLALPLIVVAVFAFNDSQFPSLPFEGFTWNWFFGSERPIIGVFHERSILRAIGTSAYIGFFVSVLSVAVGTSNAFLFNRYEFRFRSVLYVLMFQQQFLIVQALLGQFIDADTQCLSDVPEAGKG